MKPPVAEALIAFVDAATVPASCLAWLGAEERRRMDNMPPAARGVFLAAHAAVRALAARQHDASPAALCWSVSASGKPSLTDAHGQMLPVHISVAHTAPLALVGATTAGPIGVDVERVARQRPVRRLARRFFSAEEQALLDASGDAEAARLFYSFWTRKEAVLKAVGAGLAGGLTMKVDAPISRSGWRPVDHRSTRALHVREIACDTLSLAAAVAVDGPPPLLRRIEVTW